MRDLYCLHILIITTSYNGVVRFLDFYIFKNYNKLLMCHHNVNHCCQKYLQNHKETAEGTRAVLFGTNGRYVLIDKDISTNRFASAR